MIALATPGDGSDRCVPWPVESGAEQRIGINTEAAEMMGAMDRHQN
jgi:hypothetical protein